ncbi:hypothetical protein L9F63_022235, partial [Diploptera punctata]
VNNEPENEIVLKGDLTKYLSNRSSSEYRTPINNIRVIFQGRQNSLMIQCISNSSGHLSPCSAPISMGGEMNNVFIF